MGSEKCGPLYVPVPIFLTGFVWFVYFVVPEAFFERLAVLPPLVSKEGTGLPNVIMREDMLFRDLLGLDQSWEVIAAGYTRSETAVRITLRETDLLWTHEICPKCQGQPVILCGRAEPREWRHLDLFQHATFLVAALPQGQCRDCRAIHTVTPPWQGKSKYFTKPFEDHVLALISSMPIPKVCEFVRETDQRLWQMLFAYVDGPIALDPNQITYSKPPTCPESDPDVAEDFEPRLVDF